MAIIGFIIVFIIIGFIIGIVIKNNNIAMGAIIIMSILWAFAMGPWAIATFIELLLGYSLARKIL
jgi:hypothetical protein